MRVIHIISGLYQGGAENQLELLTKHMRSSEHIIISLSAEETNLSRRLQSSGFEVKFFDISEKQQAQNWIKS